MMERCELLNVEEGKWIGEGRDKCGAKHFDAVERGGGVSTSETLLRLEKFEEMPVVERIIE